jgi:protein-L-isoaspartate(D-aspartate) O-methyltransferase
LVQKSRENLSNLKINNILFKHGDGYQDWDKEKKYDGILCAAAPRQYPQDLISLLKNDAKLVIPVGSSEQKLNVISKISDNEIEEHEYDDVAFVPMLAGKSDDGNDV